jgi:TatA/E family protein of Tat protein translocase
MLGTQDLLVGLVLAAFFFGAKRLPEIARSLGQSMTEFKKAVSGGGDDPRAPDGATAALPALASTPAAVRTCATCKTALEPDWTHCPGCGSAVSASPPMPEAR